MMNHRLLTFPAVFAALLSLISSAAAQTPPSSGPFSRCDKQAADAETIVRNLSECSPRLAADRATFAAVLRASTSSGTIAQPHVPIVVTTAAMPQELVGPAGAEPMRSHLINYYSFRAFTADDPAQCAPLAANRHEKDCRERMLELNFLRALVGPPEAAAEACRRNDRVAPGRYFWSSPCCAQVAAGRGQAGACARLVPGCLPDEGTCRSLYASLLGNSSMCWKGRQSQW